MEYFEPGSLSEAKKLTLYKMAPKAEAEAVPVPSKDKKKEKEEKDGKYIKS